MLSALRRVDLVFLLPVGVLLVIGIGMVYSASLVVAHNDFGDDTYFLLRHLVWVALGLVALVVTASIDYHRWQRFALPFYLLSLFLLGLVLLPGLGTINYGASRWLTIGSLPTLQPSEVAKLAVVIYLASWITKVGGGISKFTLGTIPFVLILSFSAVLVLVEPDLGTTLILVATAASVFFFAGANILHGLLGAAVGIGLLLRFITSSGYKQDRMQAFLDPWADPTGIGWHTTQALIALGSGGLSGLGLGASRQKYYYVPNAHTDSIFAIIGEEIGFVGAILMIGLFLFIAWRGLVIAAAARDPFGRALAAGASLMIAWQGLLNMAVVSHLVPNTGVPLPFLSYGGNAMVACLTAVGLVLSVSRTADRQQLQLGALLRTPSGGGMPAEPAPRPQLRQRPVARAAHHRVAPHHGQRREHVVLGRR